MIGSGAAWLADALSRRSMPLTLLHLAENNIDVAHGVALVKALREGTPSLTELDLSANPLCGVEEGGRDDFTVAFVDALCGLLGGGGGASAAPPLAILSLADVALCGQARDGNGSYQTGAIALLAATLASPGCSLRQLSIGGCKVQDDEAHDLGEPVRILALLAFVDEDFEDHFQVANRYLFTQQALEHLLNVG